MENCEDLRKQTQRPETKNETKTTKQNINSPIITFVSPTNTQNREKQQNIHILEAKTSKCLSFFPNKH